MVLGAITPGQPTGQAQPQTRISQPAIAQQSQSAPAAYVPDAANNAATPSIQQGQIGEYLKKYGPYVAIGVLLLVLLSRRSN